MIISKLKLTNWRNFRTAELALGERVFIVGPNASGKSNLLDSIRFLKDIAKQGGGLQKAVKDRGGISKIRCLAARQNPDVEIDIELTNHPQTSVKWRYAIGIRQQVRGTREFYISHERVWKGNKQILDRPGPDDEKDTARKTQTHLEQINANAEFREVAKFLESVRYLHLVPQLVRHSEAFSGPGLPEDPFGKNFMEYLAKTPKPTRHARLKKIQAALKVAVPQFQELRDTQDEYGFTHLEAVYKNWRGTGARQREDQFSDGTLRMIGLLWSLLDGEAPLLLEEPELSLNGGIVRSLPSLMYRIQKQKRRQVFLTTHSADLLSDKGIAGEEVVLLIPGKEGTEVFETSTNKEIRLLLESGLSVSDVILPRATPRNISQLELPFTSV